MKTFLISDQHYKHGNILRFKRDDGTPLRPEFSCVQEMDEHMIDRHNAVVGPGDKVYFLGDILIGNASKFDEIMPRLNGSKILIKGNHDLLKLSNYVKYFKDIRAYSRLDKCILSHIPIRKDSLKPTETNIHGHLHYRNVLTDSVIDHQYFCVCVEQPHMKYTPIDFEKIRSILKANE